MKTKNIFLFLLFSVLPIIAFSQLSVRNNAYIYVNDQVIFVTDDVKIEETTANIYLRNDAQLVQGNGTTGNSGLGKLSVYQNGTVNEYAYNYWASPVGNVSVNDNTNRTFIANQQFYDFVGDPDPILNPITSNLASFTSGYNGSSNPLVISNAWLYSYNPGTAYNQWDYLGDTGNLAAGYGFTMKGTAGSGDNQLYDFRGKPNNGDIQTSIVASQQTLVGNPYPSALDAVDFIHDPVNSALMTGTLYYWEQAPGAASHYLVDYLGGYATYTVTPGGVDSFTPATFIAYNGDGTPILAPTGTGTKVAKRYIPIGQGFMIEGKTGIAPSNILFKNSHRNFYKQSGVDSFFFRESGDKNDKTSTTSSQQTNRNEFGAIVPSDFKRFRINIDFNNNYARQLLMNFHHTATNGFDYGLEGKSSGILNSDAYWVNDTTPYFIQAFSFDTSLKIPLVVKSENNQPINFRLFDVQNFDAAQPIYLHNIETNEYVDLRNNVYNINLPSGIYTNKFEITFTQGVLDVVDAIFENFNIYQNNTEAVLTIVNPNNLDLKSVVLYDILGKQIFKKTKLENNTQYTFSTKSLSDGIYITKVTDNHSKTFTKKVIISNAH